MTDETNNQPKDLIVRAQVIPNDYEATAEEQEFLLAAKEDDEENTIVAKLVTFGAIIHGYYKLSEKAFDKWFAEDWNKRRGDDKRIPMLATITSLPS